MIDPRARELLDGLDPQQRAVATTFGAPVVVLAGAGTGKTRAITHRIAYGAVSGRLAAERTLAVTFTTKAAGELRVRLLQLGVPRVQARTFHSAALRQLTYFWPRVYGSELPQVTSSTFSMIAEAARPLDIEITTSVLRDLVAEISWAKASGIGAERYAESAGNRQVAQLGPDQVAGVAVRYEQVKKRRGVIDFDDILLCTVAMLHEHPEVAELIRDQYRHFTVDEFQDVSPLQRTLLELWVAGREDVCVVGDLNQAIHTFAGAQPAFLARFAATHPGAVTLKLETNYRSTPQVVGAANKMISGALRLRSVRADGPQVEVAPDTDEASEARAVAAWLAARHETGVPWSELAVLYRINAQAEELTRALAEAGVPHRVKDPDPSLESGRPADPPRTSEDVVICSTIHSAKGLEWEAVAIIGASEGLLPFVLATTPAEIAEEKRLLYVGLTRAKTMLRVSWAQGAAGSGKKRQPSRFLRQAGLVSETRQGTTGARGQPRSRRLPQCRVCGRALSEASEIKLGRHPDCPADFDEALFERLREWRSTTARAQSVPAFVVFTDATLRALAEHRPTDRPGLLAVQGIGATKADRYGSDLLALIAGHTVADDEDVR